MCECALCKRNLAVVEQLKALPDSQRKFWEEMYDILLHTELDLDWNQAIVNGSWPDADRIIESRREQVRERQKQLTEEKN